MIHNSSAGTNSLGETNPLVEQRITCFRNMNHLVENIKVSKIVWLEPIKIAMCVVFVFESFRHLRLRLLLFEILYSITKQY